MVTTAKAAFEEKAKKLKEEVAEVKANEEKAMAAAKTSLEMIRANAELSELYKGAEGLGTQNLAGALPILKIHAAGKSSTNQLADGGDPNDGWYFYKPTGEQFKELTVHVLTISKGYRADGMQGKTNVFHQVLAGAIVNNGIIKPFVMYFTGIKLRALWDFGKEASSFTKNPSMPIPLFALTVKMRTVKQKTDFGYSWVPEFEIVKAEDGYPSLVTDMMKFKQLREAVVKAEDMISGLIETKSAGQMEEPPADVTHEEEIANF